MGTDIQHGKITGKQVRKREREREWEIIYAYIYFMYSINHMNSVFIFRIWMAKHRMHVDGMSIVDVKQHKFVQILLQASKKPNKRFWTMNKQPKQRIQLKIHGFII